MTFEEKTKKAENGCIEWQQYINTGGYGRFQNAQGKNILAHRYAWEQKNGVIPIGMCVLHICDNRKCVNPDHLFLGTLGDNNRDRKAKNRSASGSQHGRAKLNEEAASEIKKSRGIVSQHRLAKIHGVSRGAIQEIMDGRNWKGVTV